jgi:hypothetical protein
MGYATKERQSYNLGIYVIHRIGFPEARGAAMGDGGFAL